MIDWLASKVAISIAVLVIVSSISGFFYVQREAALDREAEQAADSLANWIDSFSSLGGETKANLTVGAGGNYAVPEQIGGKPVHLNISMGLVQITCGSRRASAGYLANVHLWLPEKGSYNASEFQSLDASHPWTGEIVQGDIVVFQRKDITASGAPSIATFAYVTG
ncbi:MAG: hypothetical protein HZB92_04635 [Euryarchaeota archaeon]|nr:hypothetical protein [Euryarchaeota archaeon]